MTLQPSYSHCKMAGGKPGDCSSRSARNNVDIAGTRKPHFFKVIGPPSLTNQKGLSIPPKFVKEYGKRLSNSARLVVPTGVIWEVELVMGIDNNLWLRKGWLEFARFFSIQYGYFLVFRYEGAGSLFRVLIFDMTATEIEYQSRIEDQSILRKPANVVHNDALVDRFVQTQDENRVAQTEDEEDNENDGVEPIKDGKNDVTHVPRNWSAVAAARQSMEVAALVRRDSGIPSFTVTATRSSVSGPFTLTIPRHYYRNYLHGQDAAAHEVVHLQSADDTDHGVPKTWSVKYRVRESQFGAYFQSGWKEFVLHHRILVGDVCVFQLVHRLPPPSLYKVTILKKSSMDKSDDDDDEELVDHSVRTQKKNRAQTEDDETDSVVLIDDDIDQVTVPRNRSAVIAATQTVDLRAAAAALVRRSGISSFTVTAPRSSVSGKFTLSIPTSYYREYLMGPDAAAQKVVLLQSADDATDDGVSMTWSVKYGVRDEKSYSYAYFYSGWKEFVLHHHIRAGDVCVFQLVHQSPPPSLYKVTILKKSSMFERRRMQA